MVILCSGIDQKIVENQNLRRPYMWKTKYIFLCDSNKLMNFHCGEFWDKILLIYFHWWMIIKAKKIHFLNDLNSFWFWQNNSHYNNHLGIHQPIGGHETCIMTVSLRTILWSFFNPLLIFHYFFKLITVFSFMYLSEFIFSSFFRTL